MSSVMRLSSLFAFLFLFGTSTVMAKGAVEEIKIKTSAQCDMCKEKLEHHMKFEKGVKTVSLDMETKELIVSFNPKKTDAEKLRTAVTKLGYSADNMAADKQAFDKLADCCKGPNALSPTTKKPGCCSGGMSKCSKGKKKVEQ